MTIAETEQKRSCDRVKWLEKRHYIDASAAKAAEFLADDYEAADRTCEARLPDTGMSGPKQPSAAPLTLRRLVAKSHIEQASAALGPDLTEVLTLVVLRNLTPSEAAEAMGIHPKAAIPLVRAGLQVLANHYARIGRQ